MVSENTSLVASTASIPTLRFDVGAVLLKVRLEVSQLAFPHAAVSFHGTEHAKILYLSLKVFVEHGIERSLANRARMAGSFDPTDARSASLVTAAAEEIGVSERKQAHGTQERIRRRVHKVAIVPSRSARISIGRYRHLFISSGSR